MLRLAGRIYLPPEQNVLQIENSLSLFIHNSELGHILGTLHAGPDLHKERRFETSFRRSAVERTRGISLASVPAGDRSDSDAEYGRVAISDNQNPLKQTRPSSIPTTTIRDCKVPDRNDRSMPARGFDTHYVRRTQGDASTSLSGHCNSTAIPPHEFGFTQDMTLYSTFEFRFGSSGL